MKGLGLERKPKPPRASPSGAPQATCISCPREGGSVAARTRTRPPADRSGLDGIRGRHRALADVARIAESEIASVFSHALIGMHMDNVKRIGEFIRNFHPPVSARTQTSIEVLDD